MNRIKELRQEKGLLQRDIERQLNLGCGNVSKYEKEIIALSPELIKQFCDLFGCTADYLLCRSSSPVAAVSDEDAALLAAYHAADQNIQNAIDALLQPWLEIDSEDARSQA